MVFVLFFRWSSTSKQLASNQLTMCIFSCLSECDRYNLKSVAIPAISCGIFGGKATECVQIILGAIKKYLASQESSVKEVSSYSSPPHHELVSALNSATSGCVSLMLTPVDFGCRGSVVNRRLFHVLQRTFLGVNGR